MELPLLHAILRILRSAYTELSYNILFQDISSGLLFLSFLCCFSLTAFLFFSPKSTHLFMRQGLTKGGPWRPARLAGVENRTLPTVLRAVCALGSARGVYDFRSGGALDAHAYFHAGLLADMLQVLANRYGHPKRPFTVRQVECICEELDESECLCDSNRPSLTFCTATASEDQHAEAEVAGTGCAGV